MLYLCFISGQLQSDKEKPLIRLAEPFALDTELQYHWVRAAERPVHEENVAWTLRGQHIVRSNQGRKERFAQHLTLLLSPLRG